jgi:hypothetical protein
VSCAKEEAKGHSHLLPHLLNTVVKLKQEVKQQADLPWITKVAHALMFMPSATGHTPPFSLYFPFAYQCNGCLFQKHTTVIGGRENSMACSVALCMDGWMDQMIDR